MSASGRSVTISTQAGMPFSATEEVSLMPSFGERKMQTTTGKVARDTRGRVYRETRLPAVGTAPEELLSMDIYDPAARTVTRCRVDEKVCRVTSLAAAGSGPKGDVRRAMEHAPVKMEEQDGLPVSRSRETLAVIPPLGGEARTVVEEALFSADLQERVFQMTKDPLSGTRTVRLKGLTRDEPNAALFELPAGYVVRDTPVGKEVPGERVSAPVVLYAPQPDMRNIRGGGRPGNVLVYLQLPASGKPMELRVLRGLGDGFDEAALDAVAHYRLKPAMQGGKPVTVEMNVEVNFSGR